MSSYLHAIANQSEEHVHLAVLNAANTQSYDVVLGPGYWSDYGPSSPEIPEPSANEFPNKRVTVDVGPKRYSLFAYGSVLRIIQGNEFSSTAPQLPGFGGSGPFELRVLANGNLEGHVYPLIERPYMTSVSVKKSPGYHIFGVSHNGQLLEKAFVVGVGKFPRPDHFEPWRELGSPRAVGLAGPVGGVSLFPFKYTVYALGEDGTIYERLQGGWSNSSAFDRSGGVPRFINLSVVSWGIGECAIYAIGENRHLYQKWWTKITWKDWEDLGTPGEGQLGSQMTAVCWRWRRYGIYALGNDGRVWQKWWDTSWSGWEALEERQPGGGLKSLTSASCPGSYALAGVGIDGQLWELIYSLGLRRGWKRWANRSQGAPRLAGAVTAVCWEKDYVYYAKAEDGLIWQLRQGKWTVLDGR